MKTKVKNILTILIIMCLIISTILLARFAWAKYIAQINGQATAQIAEMKFKINGNYYKSTDKINFSSYRDDSNPKIAKDMLAPGTYGYIPITIDATESQTSLEYEISIDLTDRPTNLKFYSNENKTEEILVKNDKIIRRGYISINNVDSSKIKHENLYWQWQTETGDNKDVVNENDIEDSKFMDKLMTMQINVKGTQIKEIPVYLSDVVSVGDKVNYKLANGEIINGMVVNKTLNQVEIMPIDNNGKAVTTKEEITLGGSTVKEAILSYNTALSEIDRFIKSTYPGATRALNVEDVNRLTGYQIEYQNGKLNKTYNYGTTFIVDELLQVTLSDGTTVLATSLVRNGRNIQIGEKIAIGDILEGNIRIESVNVICTEGSTSNSFYLYSSGPNANLEDLFNTTSFLLASKCYNQDSYLIYCLRYFYGVSSGANYNRITATHICDSSGKTNFRRFTMVPVISIPSTTHTKQITNENNPDKVIWEVTE